jgi:hypothetical protein
MAIALATQRIDAGELVQHVSRIVYRGQPLFYGCDGTNRYDAPDGSYGVIYLGLTLPTALMESVFHKHRWALDEARSIALAEVRSRLVRAVGVLEGLELADLTAPGVMAAHFGLNLEQLASRGYEHTQRISAEVHAIRGADGLPSFDGVLYPSRNNYPQPSVALFDSAQGKVRVFEDIDLVDHVDWPRFVEDYRVGVEPDPGPPVDDAAAEPRS